MKHNPKLSDYSRELRRNMTKEERHLWYDFLRNFTYQFRRQVCFGNYILDFYCAKARLAIELDGSQHYEATGECYDHKRTAFLEANGIKVLRFSNSDVNRNFRGVCEQIEYVIRNRVADLTRHG